MSSRTSDRSIDWSHIAKRATDILFLENMLGTSIGVTIGVVAHGFSTMAGVVWPKAAPVLAAVWMPFWIALGILPFALWTYSRRPAMPPEIDASLAEIRTARRRGDITDAQARGLAIQLLTKYIESAIQRSAVISNDAASEKAKAGVATPSGPDVA